ncbi:hypothetical protein COW36_04805 [bacterium (Candidatus Blackallbacteria) CG17_big_fil_post_rev_8_21_14_2_50_48_46]|uniref:Prepilin-type N-terminal cleavage/methylation domain-containing protein n=1 Tax=bacterium (Candidatus Blackallbacteria) CG17_big_fil_post_rev_8_21_14_2_50_48_46 TaxID=2014261 RepID=A0A2M7G944_9BACT|nr:MAG: hypothetical protein COW64_04140 [bacterium (Candidatus Blackallbacteria) CG18_big_fil_WC_8_21_14_2_50_49_26]PIW18615.1 MAG: hypothetical protein COW36_04805 [bacterium (Candidatus Blackallbacteria) CG17_big_fil_post_rev_8_21_14_2_50_48_46]PIW46399.1 MAG: hypothetical protein COW20_15875 [bacterium (Candidatus Blackallbacteria) CG13_big_fil_rev_8_21_14_2_50_49_14]
MKAYNKTPFYQHVQQGFTLIEALVALTIGLTLLSILIGFLLNTSKNIQLGQEQARSTSVAQLALSRITKEIKGSSIEAPSLFALTPNWPQLPALPYTAVEVYPYPTTAGTLTDPTVPAARKFFSQATPSDIYHKWYPNSADESNSLVYYAVPAPGVGNTATVERISYRLDTANPANYKLVREVQRPIIASSFNFQSSPAPIRSVLAERVQLLQFTYPEFERAMQAQGAALDTLLTNIQTNQGNAALISYINSRYRQVIGIRLIIGGSPLNATSFRKGIELTTEVRLRS